jgi:uncharacterized protein
MTAIDANLLLCAYNADAPQQGPVARWLSELLESNEAVRLPWITIWAFVRISTNPRIWDNARPAKEAFGIVGEWLAQPSVVLLQPGPRHWELLESPVLEHSAAGSLVTDAVLAALAIENGVALASTDHHFSRFHGLRWINPLRK